MSTFCIRAHITMTLSAFWNVSIANISVASHDKAASRDMIQALFGSAFDAFQTPTSNKRTRQPHVACGGLTFLKNHSILLPSFDFQICHPLKTSILSKRLSGLKLLARRLSPAYAVNEIWHRLDRAWKELHISV